MDTSTTVPFTTLLASSVARDRFEAPSRDALRELEQLRARVRELSAELVDAQESVRRHLARELHDGVGAELTATRFALASVETWLPADAPPQCAAALTLTNRSLDAVCAANRAAVAQLHAPSFEGGLAAALKGWIVEFAARTGLPTTFTCCDDARLEELSDSAALAVFRVAQEALNNAAKHARASCAEVRIEAGARELALFVSDDGIGVPRGANKKSDGRSSGRFGLAGMQARCAAYAGALRVSARGRPARQRRADSRGQWRRRQRRRRLERRRPRQRSPRHTPTRHTAAGPLRLGRAACPGCRAARRPAHAAIVSRRP